MNTALPTNKHNTLEFKNGRIVKKGPTSILRGQAFFYENYPKSLPFFPECYASSEVDGTTTLELEYIPGEPLFCLLRDGRFTTDHIDTLFDTMNMLHTTPASSPVPTKEQISAGYINKFKARLSDKTVYPFPQARACMEVYVGELERYTQSERLTCTQVIHGDYWLSNMILTPDGRIMLVDMRGLVGDLCTLGGDPLYDYAKLYQSLLGYDCCLWDCEHDSDYRNRLLDHFHSKVGDKLADIKMLSMVLMMGTIAFIESTAVRERVWNWLMTRVAF
jgi:aminoglycoside phosphotransferase